MLLQLQSAFQPARRSTPPTPRLQFHAVQRRYTVNRFVHELCSPVRRLQMHGVLPERERLLRPSRKNVLHVESTNKKMNTLLVAFCGSGRVVVPVNHLQFLVSPILFEQLSRVVGQDEIVALPCHEKSGHEGLGNMVDWAERIDAEIGLLFYHHVDERKGGLQHDARDLHNHVRRSCQFLNQQMQVGERAVQYHASDSVVPVRV
mmetsp:Transcript_18392/g.44330  ORF Transcript_18392/g.44330 Transcript_18392/m.44330 type:complete len:204 (+) Transcript_18392:610-1221(+)